MNIKILFQLFKQSILVLGLLALAVFIIDTVWENAAGDLLSSYLDSDILDKVEALSIIGGLIVYIIQFLKQKGDDDITEEPTQEDKERKIKEAWEIIISRKGQQAELGRIEAIQYLNQEGINLSGLEVPKAILERIQLPNANLKKANFSAAYLSNADFTNADLSKANLQKADLSNANLSNANLSDTNLSEANLEKVNLSNANLCGANLSNTKLIRANLSGAKLDNSSYNFHFDIITVDSYGKEINRRGGGARQEIEILGNGINLEMIYIPGGSFIMGSPEGERFDWEKPQHKVNVPSFWMGKFQVTQAQWKVVAALPKVNRDLKPEPSRFKGNNRPVKRVSWYDAVEFCARLSKFTGKEYRLPSEAEWEYACRAGTTTPFHFGETITSELANYNANYTYGTGPKGKYRRETTPVGQFPPNAFGLYDMHGNLYEWCLDDWHDNYKDAPTDGSPWFDDNNNLSQKSGKTVLRGGSWDFYPKNCRSASRDDYYRADRDVIGNGVGFRVVCGVGRILE